MKDKEKRVHADYADSADGGTTEGTEKHGKGGTTESTEKHGKGESEVDKVRADYTCGPDEYDVKSSREVPRVGDVLVIDQRTLDIRVINPETDEIIKPTVIHVCDMKSMWSLGFILVIEGDLKKLANGLLADAIAAWGKRPKKIYMNKGEYDLRSYAVLGVEGGNLIPPENYTRPYDFFGALYDEFGKFRTCIGLDTVDPFTPEDVQTLFLTFTTTIWGNMRREDLGGKSPKEVVLEAEEADA